MTGPTRFVKIRTSRGSKVLPRAIKVRDAPHEVLFFPSGASTGGRFTFSREGLDDKVLVVSAISGYVFEPEE